MSDSPEWPEDDAGAKRLGYLRNGAIVEAYDVHSQRALPKSERPESQA